MPDRSPAELLDDLQDARADLARYRRMLANFGAGAAVGIAVFALCGVLSAMFGWPDGSVAMVAVPAAVVAAVCIVGMMCRVVSANEYNGRNHPEKAVRAASRAYSKAVTEENVG